MKTEAFSQNMSMAFLISELVAENSLFCLNNWSTWNQLSVPTDRYLLPNISYCVSFIHYYCGCSKRNTHKKFHSVISHVLL